MLSSTVAPDSTVTLDHLQGLLSRGPAAESRRCFSSGCEALNRRLPEGGFRAGSLVEWISGGSGSGASLLAMLAVRELHRQGEAVAVIDRGRRFYPPAAAAWGIELSNTIVVRPTSLADELWAIDQTLRSSHLTAVVAWPEKIDSFAFRRFQLAAEESGALGLFVRPAAARREPTWAHLRLAVEPRRASADGVEPQAAAWRRRIRLLRCRGGAEGDEFEWELNESL